MTLHFVENESYEVLKSVILSSGKGRRPNIPASLSTTKKLFLQVLKIKEDSGRSWEEISSSLSRIFPSYPREAFRPLIEKIYKEASSCVADSFDEFLEVLVDLNYVGPHIAEFNIGRRELNDIMSIDSKITLEQKITNGVIIDLEQFRLTEKRKCRLNMPSIQLWLERLLNCKLNENQLQQNVQDIMKNYRALSKDKKRNPERLHSFLKSGYEYQDEETSGMRACNCNVKTGTELRSLRGKLEERERSCNAAGIQIEMLKEECKEKSKMLDSVQIALKKTEEELTHWRDRCVSTMSDLKAEREKGKSEKYINCFKRLKRRENKIKELMKIVGDGVKSLAIKEAKQRNLKRKVKSLQTLLSNERQKKKTLCEAKEKAEGEICSLVNELENVEEKKYLIMRKGASETSVRGNGFTSDVTKCVIELMGEADVAASRCGQVISIVAKHMYQQQVHERDLISIRTALRFADKGHVLAKEHIACEVTTDTFDLHADGTSRDSKKYVGHQVTTASGRQLSLGFTPVHTEDTSTLLDVAIKMLDELSFVHEDENPQASFRDILSNLVATMSDRASVMKSYNCALNKKRQEELGTSENIEFLHCNAHFLLGLSSVIEKVLKSIEDSLSEAQGTRLGRDSLPLFSRFSNSSEAATARYIRTTCDCLGPRSDEKNGCRQEWLAFCAMSDKSSHISSFRSNRFNNFFEGAASLIFHHQDIVQFLTDYKTEKNLKLQSVLADANSPEINLLLLAVAIIYFTITGPFWKLINSNIQYLDLHSYITPMVSSFRSFSNDSSTLFSLEGLDVGLDSFSVDGGEAKKSVCSILNSLDESKKQILKNAFEKIFKGFTDVAERQLKDFLPGGVYYQVTNEDQHRKLRNSAINNLLGEACFGDLDYSQFKRRHSSLHHHSTINMMKRNKTMSTWFNKKSSEEQHQLLASASKKSKVLRKKHMETSAQVTRNIQQKLSENKEREERKKKKSLQEKTDIILKVQQNNGPFKSSVDVDQAMASCKNKSEKINFLKLQIKYQKLVLGKRDKRLVTSKRSVSEIVNNLKSFFDGKALKRLTSVCNCKYYLNMQ